MKTILAFLGFIAIAAAQVKLFDFTLKEELE